MTGNSKYKSIAAIPVKVEGSIAQKFHWKRRATQAAFILLAILIPVSGLLRIDPEVGAFVVWDRQIWFSDFFLMSGLWITLASGLVLLYSSAGTVFCGWACPQNTLAEWANNMTRWLLGKRAEVSLSGGKPRVAAAKNKVINWLLLGLSFLVVAMLFALIPLFYFYPPVMVWHFVTFQQDAQLARSLHWIYAVCVLILFLDIALIRHFWCRFSCIYRVWQHSFKTRETLHVSYNATRSEECAKCNFCSTSCFIGLDPRKTDIYDSCINCGECIDACNRLHEKQGVPGLLCFEIGARKSGANPAARFHTAMVSLLSRTKWASAFTILGASLFAWGMWSYEPYHVAVYRSENQQSKTIQDYRIAIANKRYRPEEYSVQVDGLPQESYNLSSDKGELLPAGRDSVNLAIAQNLPYGLYSIVITVSTPDGWSGEYRLQHFAETEGKR